MAFYSRLLTEVQGRAPEFGSLILKDGREERFRLADFEPALDNGGKQDQAGLIVQDLGIQ